MATTRLTRRAAQESAPNWRYLLDRLHLAVSFADFATAAAFVADVARLAEEQNHHPDLDIRYSWVHVTTVSHDAGGITDRDIRLATAIDEAVRARGGKPDTGRLSITEIAIDTMDAEVIRPFWQAAMGYRLAEDGTLVDPKQIGPGVWFQQLDEPRPVRNRIHLDVTVAHDEVEERLERVLAAGGRLVSDARAPAFWIVADADGNEVCLCTWQGRDED